MQENQQNAMSLVQEYRKTMGLDILHSWAGDAKTELYRLYEMNEELLDALESMLREFGNDTNGIGAKERCAVICFASEVVEKYTGNQEC